MTAKIEFMNRSTEDLRVMIEPIGNWFNVPPGSKITIEGQGQDISDKVQVEYGEPQLLRVWMDDLDYRDMNITIAELRF